MTEKKGAEGRGTKEEREGGREGEWAGPIMVTVDCSSTYSEDGFELSTSPVSSVFQAGHTSDEDSNNISGSNTTDERSYDDSTSDGRSQEQAIRGEQVREKKDNEEKPPPPASSATVPDNRPSLSNNGNGDGGTGGEASPEPSAYSPFGSPARSDEGEQLLPIQSSFVLVTDQDSRTAKQVLTWCMCIEYGTQHSYRRALQKGESHTRTRICSM